MTHPHGMEETWREDGKCIVKSCEVYKPVEDLYADVQQAVNDWVATLSRLGSFKAATIPVEALPYLRKIWRARDEAE